MNLVDKTRIGDENEKVGLFNPNPINSVFY